MVTVGQATERMVRAPADCLLTKLCVRPHEQVICGDVLCEVILKDAKGGHRIVEIIAPDWGIVKPIAGTRIFLPEKQRKVDALFLRKDSPLLLITREKTGNDAGTIKGLTPRPTSVMHRRRLRYLMMYYKRATM